MEKGGRQDLKKDSESSKPQQALKAPEADVDHRIDDGAADCSDKQQKNEYLTKSDTNVIQDLQFPCCSRTHQIYSTGD
jgi:hypothetical protein